jgi:hypothetical protein
VTSSRRAQIKFLVEAELRIPSPVEGRLGEAFTATDKSEVERIVRGELKDKATEEMIVKIVRNVLVQLYKTLYNRRSFWTSAVNGSPE